MDKFEAFLRDMDMSDFVNSPKLGKMERVIDEALSAVGLDKSEEERLEARQFAASTGIRTKEDAMAWLDENFPTDLPEDMEALGRLSNLATVTVAVGTSNVLDVIPLAVMEFLLGGDMVEIATRAAVALGLDLKALVARAVLSAALIGYEYGKEERGD